MNFIHSIDIFCAVVDNFGDIGVCWRLARQMSVEHCLSVRLFIDDIQAASSIIPDDWCHVDIIHWTDGLKYDEAAEIVIEAFACSLPDVVIAAMVRKQSVWIDLEYLSAEDWVSGCHAIPSRHPTTGLTKTLFFPGLDAKTGGLIREKDLISRKNAFINDKNAQNQWRLAHFIPEIDDNFIDISVFFYQTAPFEQFFLNNPSIDRPIRLIKPVRNPSGSRRYGAYVEVVEIPFMPQYDYDYLLWTSNFNFVRGEDSFVRAQFAGKPFIWNIYVQDENAHLLKLKAFLEKIRPFYDGGSFERLAILHDLWNEGGQIKTEHSFDVWGQSLHSLAGLESGARGWSDDLLHQTDLSTRLLAFASTQIKQK